MPKKYQLYALGNALVDIVVQVSEAFLFEYKVKKGHMTLVDSETQARMLSRFSPSARLCCSGGSAANTAVAFAQLGGRCFYACQLGDDEMGRFYLKDLRAAGVHSFIEKTLLSQGRTGTCLVMVSPDAERSMYTHLGCTGDISAEHVDEKVLQQAEWLYMEGYLLSEEKGTEALFFAKSIAQKHNIQSALSLSDPSIVAQKKDKILTLLEKKVDMLFCNQEEASLFTGTRDLERSCKLLEQFSRRFAITLGEQGALLYDSDTKQSYLVPTPSAQVVDTNGAGDMFAGAFLYGLTKKYSLKAAAQLGCRAASAVVAQLGPRLRPSKLKTLLK